jgi:hypothetical protein
VLHPPILAPHAIHPCLMPRAPPAPRASRVVRYSRLASLAPHVACRLRLTLRSAAPHVSCLDSRYTQPMSDLRVVASSSMLASRSATSIHWGVASWWAHVATACFMCFRYMLHILQWLYTYVASVCFTYFSYFKRMLQVFYLDVAYVALVIHVWCKRMF